MPRNSAGVYTLPAGINPVVAGTVIMDTWANPTLDDIAAAITDSVDRAGRGGMTGPFRIDDGTVGLPGLAFDLEPSTGLYRIGTGSVGFSILGTKIFGITDNGLALRPGSASGPPYSFASDSNTGMWSPAADTIAWSVAGGEVVRITSAGKVGIGRTPNAQLDVTMADNAFTTGTFHNTRAGNSFNPLFSATNDNDADFVVWVSEVGAATKLARIGTSVAIDLQFATNNTEKLRLTSDGRLFGTALHDNAGAVTGTVNQYIASGTYSPIFSSLVNASAASSGLCQWVRVGNVVQVSGLFTIDPTSASILTGASMSLPIPSDFTTAQELGGTAVRTTSASPSLCGLFSAATIADNAVFSFIGDADVSSRIWSFSFTYLIS